MMNRRLRGQRISRQELIEESRKVLDAAGVANNARAKFVTEIARIIVGTPEPIYTQLQPKIIQHDTQAWIKAFALMFQYLNDHNLTETIAAIEAEFGQGPLPNEVLEDQGIDSNRQFNELLAGIPKKMPFKARVLEFMERTEKPKPVQKPKLQPKRKTPKKESPKGAQRSAVSRYSPIKDELGLEFFSKDDEARLSRGKGPTPKKVHRKGRKTPGRKASPTRDEIPDLEESKRPVRKQAALRKRQTKPAPAKAKKVSEIKAAQDEKAEEELLDDFVIDVVIPAKGH